MKVTGATVHFVNEMADGGAVISHKAVEIQNGDTPEILQKAGNGAGSGNPASGFPCSATGRLKFKMESHRDGIRPKGRMNYESSEARLRARSNTYPGRGIVLGKSEDSRHAAVAYFIMGRSENSRNGFFQKLTVAVLKPRRSIPPKVVDPSLIIYNVVLVLETTIVTNGDQTDTVYDYLKGEKPLRAFTDPHL